MVKASKIVGEVDFIEGPKPFFEAFHQLSKSLLRNYAGIADVVTVPLVRLIGEPNAVVVGEYSPPYALLFAAFHESSCGRCRIEQIWSNLSACTL